MVGLKSSLQRIPGIKAALRDVSAALLRDSRDALSELHDLVFLVGRAVRGRHRRPLSAKAECSSPGTTPSSTNSSRLASSGKSWVKKLQEEEIEKTGIKSLKVLFNKVFGYYNIEVTKSNHPAGFPPINPQTDDGQRRALHHAQLKEQEPKFSGAEERRKDLDRACSASCWPKSAATTRPVRETAAPSARSTRFFPRGGRGRHNYTRPVVDAGEALEIRDGRHPVVESRLGEGRVRPQRRAFDGDKNRIFIITGPKMAAIHLHRQVALITLMAQTGSFVRRPLRAWAWSTAFSRASARATTSCAASSTFLVEMNETALILHHATPAARHSGRNRPRHEHVRRPFHRLGGGPSTLPAGSAPRRFCNALPRAHGGLPGSCPRGHYNVSVREWNDEVIFVHKDRPVGCDKSYGHPRAKLAGLPPGLIARAYGDSGQPRDDEPRARRRSGRGARRRAGRGPVHFFRSPPPREEHPLLKEILAVDPDRLTPPRGPAAHRRLARPAQKIIVTSPRGLVENLIMRIPEAFKNFNRRLIRGGQKVLLAVFLSLIYARDSCPLTLRPLCSGATCFTPPPPTPGESLGPGRRLHAGPCDCRRQS